MTVKKRSRLIIFNIKVDAEDDILAFFCDWLYEFSQHYEEVLVFSTHQGVLPKLERVKFYKVGGGNWLARLKGIAFIYLKLFGILLEAKPTSCLVHMAPIYALLTKPLLTFFNVPIYLWYNHRQKTISLKLAEKCVKLVFSATAEGFLIDSKKLRVVGHGVTLPPKPIKIVRKKTISQIGYVGRISSIKNIDLIIDGFLLYCSKPGTPKNVVLKIFGSTITRPDEIYYDKIKRSIASHPMKGRIFFMGSLPYGEMRKQYSDLDVLVNLSPSGGLDKAGLEAMISSIPVVFQNPAYEPILLDAKIDRTTLKISGNLAESLSSKLTELTQLDPALRGKLGDKLMESTQKLHGLERLIALIVSYFK